MAASKTDGKRVSAKAKLEALQLENEQLKKTVEGLRKANVEGVNRLTEESLLRNRIHELEKRLSGKADG